MGDRGASPLVESSVLALGRGGALDRCDPGFIERRVQLELTRAVSEAIDDRATLVAEAGTGVGKTFAYLVPLLLARQRAIVSTATKNLQDQLFTRDLPRLTGALGVPVRTALLKGRSSYLCLHRLDRSRASASLPDRTAVRSLARVERWAAATATGDLAEVDGLDERSPVIPLVTSTRDNCLGGECPSFRDCHVVRARRDAMAADLVVVNHHLFFADLALRDTGVAELLPSADIVVFDEAHQLTETGLQFLATTVSTAQAVDLGRDLLAAGLAHARGLGPWRELASALETASRQLHLACAGPNTAPRGTVRLRWDARAADAGIGDCANALGESARAVARALVEFEAVCPDFTRLIERARSIASRVDAFGAAEPAGRVRWIELGPRDARLVESPLDIRDLFAEQRAARARAWIFTSATLGTDDELRWFCEAAALEDARKLRLGSPFDYAAHARTWVPPRFVLPNHADHPNAVGRLAARLASRLDGRTFVLTTTLRVLPLIADAIASECAAIGSELEVLVQGSAPKRRLLERFVDASGSVLVGSASFWEGVDIAGDALLCVVIDKLPFPPPSDPLVQARRRALEGRGRDPFADYFLAEAAIALKQGAGRLIRTETDRGLLVICDTRLRQMPYGRRLRAALPPMGSLDTESDALAWLDSLCPQPWPD